MKYVVAICTVEGQSQFCVRQHWDMPDETSARLSYRTARKSVLNIKTPIYTYAVGVFDVWKQVLIGWALIHGGRVVRSWGWL